MQPQVPGYSHEAPDGDQNRKVPQSRVTESRTRPANHENSRQLVFDGFLSELDVD